MKEEEKVRTAIISGHCAGRPVKVKEKLLWNALEVLRCNNDHPASCPKPCCMSMSILHAYVHAACPCSCCMPVSMLHAHVHAACPCACCISMSMLHVHVHAACPCQCCMFTPMLHAHAHAVCSCLCCMLMTMPHVLAACPQYVTPWAAKFAAFCKKDRNKPPHIAVTSLKTRSWR
jgi:hypothetical protein